MGSNCASLTSVQKNSLAVVFLHGFAQGAASWRKQLNSLLADTYRLVAFDMRGHGDSQPKEGVTYADGQVWAEDIETVRKGLGVEKMVLVGWSYGAIVLGAYLKYYGEKHVAGAVITGGGSRVTPAFFGAEFVKLVPHLLAKDPKEFREANEDFVDLLLAQSPSQAEEKEIVKLEEKTPASVRAEVFGRKDINVSEAYKKLDVPLLIVGAHDEVVNFHEAIKLMKETNPKVEPKSTQMPAIRHFGSNRTASTATLMNL